MGKYGKIPELAMEVLFAGKIIELYSGNFQLAMFDDQRVTPGDFWCLSRHAEISYSWLHTHIYIYNYIIYILII